MEEPLVIVTDPKAPRQPVPAHDGADYLKTIPGFSVMRKGGTDGEPILRGMAGSRINILVDGQNVLGGCSMRMDAPTSYIFPEAFDQLTVMKGPQTVLHGPGASAGSVMFDRHLQPMQKPGVIGNGSLLVGSYGRHDEVADIKVGNESVYARITGTNSQADDYRDGDSNKTHSKYHRYSFNTAVGLTPDPATGVEVSAAYSNGEAAYADRAMDGIEFRRANVGLRFEKRELSEFVEKVDFQLFHNDIDHLMDDYTMRTYNPTNFMGWARLQHRSTGGKASGILKFTEDTQATIGADFQLNVHSKGAGSGAGMMKSTAANIAEDSNFMNVGLFGEVKHKLTDNQRLIAGYRGDQWEAKDKRTASASATSGLSRDVFLNSGFVRFEKDFSNLPVTAYFGLGHAERFPDYWELIASVKNSTSNSAFLSTSPERTNQLDIGAISNVGRLSLSASAFYSHVDDFILIDGNTGYKMTTTNASRNINAYTYGAEVDMAYKLTDDWKLNSSLAYVYGNNETDHKPLAQLPPLEFKLGFNYDNRQWFVGGLFRAVTAQDRFSVGQGNIAGTDIGRSGGFTVTSINAGWRPTKESLISVGIDNIFDKTYAEFVSRAGGNGMGGAITGFVQTTRVNEMGRTFWLKGNISF